MRAGTELDNLLKVAEYKGHESDDGRHPEATRGWDKYKTRFTFDKQNIFEGIISIELTERGDIFYDLINFEQTAFNIKENTPYADFSVSNGVPLNNIISQNAEKSTENTQYSYRWKPNKSAAIDYAQKMQDIKEFCAANNIHQSKSGDSYYFAIDGQDYRVSNHTVDASNRGAYDEFGNQVRDFYHPDGEENDVIYITAGKTRIMDIYNDLKNGYALDRRGNRVVDKSQQFSLKKVDDNQISLLDLLKEVPKEWDAEFMDKATQNVDKLLKEFNINEGESFDRNKEGDEVGRRGVEGIRRIFTQRGPKTAEQSRIYDQFVEQNNGFEITKYRSNSECLEVKEEFYTYEMIRQAQVNKENGLDTVFYLGRTRNTATHREGNASGFYIHGRNIIYISTSLHGGNADVVVASTGSNFLIQQKSVGQKG